MPTPVETILTSAGIPAEDVTKIISLQGEEAEKFDANPYLEKVSTNYKTRFENDPKFFSDITLEKLPVDVKKKIEGSQFARAANIVRDKLIKGLGMTEADYSDLSEDQKKELDSFIPAIVEKFSKNKAGDKELQAQLIEARKKIESFDGYEEKIKGQYEIAAEQKITAAIFNANLIGELSRIQGLKIAASDIAKTANDILSSKYAFERVGDFAVELRQKANPQMKVLKNGSSHELTLADALLEIATERNWVEKQEDSKNGSGKVIVTPTKDGLKTIVPPHLQDKISQKIAAQKQ
jgi:hypothetical protein